MQFRWPTWWGFRWLVAVVILVSALCGLAPSVAQPVYAAGATSPSFPRLATIYSKDRMNTAATQAAIAKFNLYVTDFVNWPAMDTGVDNGKTEGQHMKALNPNLIAIIYRHSNMIRETTAPLTVNGTTYYVDPRWLLTLNGSALTKNINASTTSIPVGDLSLYAVNDRVMIGGPAGQSDPEIVKVTARSASTGAGTLTVSRASSLVQGGKFGAIAHNSGDWVRSIAYTLDDPAGAMLFNVTSTAVPTLVNPSLGPQTWNDYLASSLAMTTAAPAISNVDGVFLDNFIDKSLQIVHLPKRVDINGTNQPTGIDDTLWTPGMIDIATKVQAALPPSWIVIGNTGGQSPLLAGAALNGGMIEGIRQDGHSLQGTTAGAIAYYNSWMAAARGPATFIMNGTAKATTLAGAQTNYQAMRFLLTLTLTNDGYFSYDEFGANGGHQTFWWYDEYDNAGKGTGYLGMPLGPATQPLSGVYRRDFDNGISLVNTSATTRTIELGGVFQKIKGKQVPSVNNGQAVTTVTLKPNDGIILLRQLTATPKVTAVSPRTGAEAGGTKVTITGTNLSFGTIPTSVSIGGHSATVVTQKGTSLTVTLPALPAGIAPVSIVNAAGTASFAAGISVLAPKVTSVSPAHARAGTVLTVHGTGLLGVTHVQFTANGGPWTAPATIVNATTLKVTVPSGAGLSSLQLVDGYGWIPSALNTDKTFRFDL